MAPNFFGEQSPYLNHPLLTEERTSSEVDHLVRLLGLKPGATVLDLGCGFGRHTVELARRGHSVTAVDPSATMIAAAKAAAAAADPTPDGELGIEFVVANAQDLALPNSGFDAAICLFTTLGQIDATGEDNRAMLGSVRPALKPGGRLVVEVPQRGPAVDALVERDVFEHRDGKTEISRRFDADTSRVIEQFLIHDGSGPPRRFDLEYRLFSAEELHDLLLDAGFASIDLADSLADAVARTTAEATLSPDGPTMIATGITATA